MLKIAALVFALIFCFSLVNASIYLIKPVEKQVFSGEQIDLGEIAKGETLELIASSSSGTEIEWNAMKIEGLTPQEWMPQKSVFYGKTVDLKIKISANAEEGIQNIKVKVFNQEKPEISESFNAVLFVKSNLVTVQVNNLKQETIIGKPVEFKIFLLNDSIAEHTVIISSTLPKYWFKGKEIKLKPKELREEIVSINPKTYGFKKFSFEIISKLNNSKIKSIKAELKIKPTLQSIYFNAFYGFPFFSPTLFPYYLINSFLSLTKPS